MDFEPGNFYHIFNRGNNKQEIFLRDENYDFFLRQLHSYFKPAGVNLIVYCLMPNHFHLVVELSKPVDFSNLMRSFGTSYVKSFNNWNNRVGHLYQQEFQWKLVESDEYLIHACRYIHLNPVNAGLVKQPQDWQHSDFRIWISEVAEEKSRRSQLRNELVGDGKDYQEFVMDYDEAKKEEQEVEAKLFGTVRM